MTDEQRDWRERCWGMAPCHPSIPPAAWAVLSESRFELCDCCTMWMPAVRPLLGLALYSHAMCNDFFKSFLFSPCSTVSYKKKNIIRIPSSWICILAEFIGTHYVPHLLKHRSADPELNCRLHFPWKYMQIVIYLPISTHAGFSHNMDLALKELFPNLWCRIKLKKKIKKRQNTKTVLTY